MHASGSGSNKSSREITMNNVMGTPAQYGRTASQSSPGLIAHIATWKAGLLKRVLGQDLTPFLFLDLTPFLFLLCALGLGASAALATTTTSQTPTHFHRVGYFASSDEARQACENFASSLGFSGYCHQAYSSPVWEAGWLCDNYHWPYCWGNSFLGDFYFTTSCATGLSVDENTGACVPNPKNAGATPDGTCVGNPINAGAATKYQIEIDVTSGLEFSRSYNSRMVKGSSDIGTNWRHSYLRTVSLGLNGDTADVYRSDGKTVRFMLNGTNWVADPDISDRLEQLAAASGWRYILAADNSVETYDATGKLLTLTDRAGHTQTLSYDTTGQLTAVTDAHGRSLVFTHDTADRIATLTDPAGGVTTYTYDANNNLASVTYPDATGKTYHYEDPAFPHALTGISDENGARYATYAYDAQGRAILSEHAGSAERVELTYNPDGSTTVTDALGSARSYNFETHLGVVKSTGISQPGGSGCGAASSAITYDANGNPASRDDFNGHRTRYWHDQGFATPRNLETTRVEGLAVENGNETVKPETRTIYTEWHPVWRLPTVEKTYTGGADAQGVPLGSMVREINATYDASGNLLVRTERDSQRSESRTWTYTWHSLGRLARIDGPRTDVQDITTYSYYPDDDPDLGRRGQLWQTTNALGHITEIQAYDLHGHPTRVRDPNNLITDYTYTARGWLNTRSAAGRLTSYTYDPAGQLTRVALPNGASLEYTYDAAHRLTGIRNAWNERIQYQLDAQGNILTETVFDAQGMQSRKLDRQYDALGRLWKDIRRVNGQDATTEYGYDAQGNRTLLSAPLSLGLRTRYDALDRLAGTEDAMMGEPGLGYTRLDRNALDAVTTFIDTNRTATAYEIDAYGQVRKETSPDRGDTTYTYDPAGNLKTRTDARGKTITYSHDALDRPTRIDRPNGTDTVFTWDMSPVSKGRLDRMQDEAGDTNWSYNPHGEVIGKTQTGLTRSVGYTYQNGNLTRLAYPSGAYVDYIWSQGRITDVRLNGAPLLSGIRYQAFGEPTGWTWSNGQSYSQGHDSETGWPQSYPLGDRNRSLSYDAGGRISGYRHDGQPNLDHDFGYDILDRLTDQSTYQGSTGWDYDPNGNRSLHRSGSATYLYDYTPFTKPHPRRHLHLRLQRLRPPRTTHLERPDHQLPLQRPRRTHPKNRPRHRHRPGTLHSRRKRQPPGRIHRHRHPAAGNRLAPRPPRSRTHQHRHPLRLHRPPEHPARADGHREQNRLALGRGRLRRRPSRRRPGREWNQGELLPTLPRPTLRQRKRAALQLLPGLLRPQDGALLPAGPDWVGGGAEPLRLCLSESAAVYRSDRIDSSRNYCGGGGGGWVADGGAQRRQWRAAGWWAGNGGGKSSGERL
ncbi:MAG: hypothetical protein B7Y41_11965 [Hydrogenophilales bacterium 28-61-23]|nr:MAG: hypothetical protein B7Y41_11965 [Hydrogenophilales bacterium 28-61-23]